MVARKRQQGQARRIARYLKRETGSTNPQALVLRCNQLREAIERMTTQIEKTQSVVEKQSGPADSDSSEVETSADTHPDKRARAQEATQKMDDTLATQFRRMCEMREKYTEMLRLNQEIYRKLVGAPMIERQQDDAAEADLQADPQADPQTDAQPNGEQAEQTAEHPVDPSS